MTPDLYTKCFAVGYYYGRALSAMPLQCKPAIPEQDSAIENYPAFEAGYKAGVEDFENIDLPFAALSNNGDKR